MPYRIASLGSLLCAYLLAGCSGSQVTRTEWAPSPDSQWLTHIIRYDNAGPGTNSLYESVQLKRRGRSKAVVILTLDEGEMTGKQLAGGPVITLVWSDPHHLRIRERAGQVLHQVSRIADLSISTRE